MSVYGLDWLPCIRIRVGEASAAWLALREMAEDNGWYSRTDA